MPDLNTTPAQLTEEGAATVGVFYLLIALSLPTLLLLDMLTGLIGGGCGV